MISKKDQSLLKLLNLNARMSLSELARQLGVSRTTVQTRLQRLEDTGVIAGYTIRVGEEAKSGQISAYVNITLDASAQQRVAAALEPIAEIEALFSVSGKTDCLAILRANSPSELDRCLDKIAAIQGVRTTESAIILATKFDRR